MKSSNSFHLSAHFVVDRFWNGNASVFSTLSKSNTAIEVFDKTDNPNGKPLFGQQDYAKGAGKLPENPTFIMADPEDIYKGDI